MCLYGVCNKGHNNNIKLTVEHREIATWYPIMCEDHTNRLNGEVTQGVNTKIPEIPSFFPSTAIAPARIRENESQIHT